VATPSHVPLPRADTEPAEEDETPVARGGAARVLVWLLAFTASGVGLGLATASVI
jgi:hypothetical protein